MLQSRKPLLFVFLLLTSFTACTSKDDPRLPWLALVALQQNGSAYCGLSSNGLATADELLLQLSDAASFDIEGLKLRDPSMVLLSINGRYARLQTQRESAFYEAIPGVVRAQRNYVYRMQLDPNDAMYTSLTWPALIDAPTVWSQRTDCSQTVVAVIDSGIGLSHSEFAGRLWTNSAETAANGVDDDANGYIDDLVGWDFVENDAIPNDLHGHGTHVAGMIGAAGNNGTGVTGVCWNSRIMVLRVFDSAGLATADRIVKAVDYAVENGASVINLSLGGAGGESGDLTYQAIERARSQDVLVVAAAGNAGTDNDTTPFFPASYDLDNIIAVASSSAVDGKSSFSNYGAASVDLAAPGESVLSTYPFLYGIQEREPFGSVYDWHHTSSSWRVEEVEGPSTRACGISDPSGIGRFYSANMDAMAYRQYDPQGFGPVRLSFLARVDTEPLNDRFEVLWGVGESEPDRLLTFTTGHRYDSVGWIQYSFLLEESGPIELGFRLKTNDSIEADGVSITGLTLQREIEASAYTTLSGTSMATPLVAGAAALLRSADPGCSYLNVRTAILNGGRSVPSFVGKTTTGRILDINGAGQAISVLGCSYP